MSELSLYYLTIGFYLISSLCYLGYLLTKNDTIGKVATGTAFAGLLSNFAGLIMRTVTTGHPPFTNMYEYSSSFAFGVMLIYLFAEWKYDMRIAGAFVVPVAFVLEISTMMLGLPFEGSKELMPALQSNWLHAHVATAIIAYGAFAFSCGLAIMYLWKEKMEAVGSTSWFNRELPRAALLDELSYRFIAFGFPLMSLVIITGAVWAEFAWGRYWSWDPKETWSLITWLVYSAYLHARLTYGWKGRRAAWMAIIGFLTVLFTYFGVNILLPGLHSYSGS
ncbi:MAG: c-type cytochrome biogenesis protein CcsB [Bacillota bacterium]